MVSITQNPATMDFSQPMNIVFAPIKFLMDNAFTILILVVITIGIVVFVTFYWMKEEQKKEQEDMLYKEYKDTIRTAIQNRQANMYTKKYSKFNFFFLGIPIFKYKVGRKIYNKRQEIVGFYDGRFTDMLGCENLLLWKDKSFIFFKNYFVLRLPTVLYKSKIQQAKEKNTAIEVSFKPISGDLIIDNPHDKTITINMINHKKSGYYFYPVYQDDKNQILDLTETINTINHVNHSNILLQEVIKESGKNVIGMAKTNTELVFRQREPEKVQDIDKGQ